MKQGRYTHKPLLYIEQPNMNAPEASMQSSYRSGQRNKVQKASQDERIQEKAKPQQRNEKNVFHEQLIGAKRPQQKKSQEKQKEETVELEQDDLNVESIVEQDEPEEEVQAIEANTEQTDSISTAENKPFNKLDIKGKVDYFLNKPTLMPDMKCEVRTASEVHYGVIDDFQDEQVRIRKKKQANPAFVPINEITSIRILGF